MILTPQHLNAHLPSTWTAALCATVLGVGLHGATQPVLPTLESAPMFLEIGEDPDLVEFQAPGEPAAEQPEQIDPEQIEEPIEEDYEVPPVPEMVAPLTPPEMPNLTALEEPPPPAPEPPKIIPKPDPKPPKPVPPKPRKASRPFTPGVTGTGTGGGGGSGPPTVFNSGGGGRYPLPSYPQAARSAQLQGIVRLLVVVEASGMPSSVSVQMSCGHSILDSAARDHISRRWRWPKGETRRYIVPVRFVLQ